MNKQKRSLITAWLTCLSLVVSLVAGIMVSDSASAKSNDSKDAPRVKASDDLLEKARGPRGSDLVPVILQLNRPMSGELNAFLNQNGVHGAKKIFSNLNAQLIE